MFYLKLMIIKNDHNKITETQVEYIMIQWLWMLKTKKVDLI